MADIEAISAAAVDLLKTDARLTVYDGPPKPSEDPRVPPYVVVYAYTPRETASKLIAVSDWADVAIVTHSVGGSMLAAGIVRRNVRENFLDARLVAAGWACQRMEHEGLPAAWDQSTGTTVADAVDEWTLRAQALA